MNVLFFIFLYYAASEILPNFIQNSQDIFRVLALKGIRGIPIAGQHRTHAYKEVKSRFSDKNYLPATFSFRLYDFMPKSVSIATSRVRNRIYICVYMVFFNHQHKDILTLRNRKCIIIRNSNDFLLKGRCVAFFASQSANTGIGQVAHQRCKGSKRIASSSGYPEAPQ